METFHRTPTKRVAAAIPKAMLVLVLATLAALPVMAAGDGGEGLPRTNQDASAGSSSGESLTLTLAGGEVTVTYPDDLVLALSSDQLIGRSAMPACAEPFDYCLYLPGGAYIGTNLSSAGLRVNVRRDLTAQISCLLAQPGGYADRQPGVARAGAYSTSRFGDLGEGAAGSYSHGELYRLWTGDHCYEFETRQVLTRFENYEPGAVAEFTTADQRDLELRFLAVLGSATLAGGEAVSWPLEGASDLEEFVQLHAPLQGESVRSPLTLTGQAVGNWFFEGSFPLEMIGADGETIAAGYVTAEGDWMTTDLVRFGGALEFEVNEPTEAILVLRRDNPSDLREHDAAVRVPLTLMPE